MEAARLGVVVAVPRLRAELDAIASQRGAAPATPHTSWRSPREIVFISGFLLAIISPALVLPSPRNGRPALGVDTAALWVGVVAAVAIIIFATLEPRRRDSIFIGAHTRNAPRLYLFFAVLWAAVFAYILGNWGEVNRFEPQLPTTGLVLLGLSVVGMAVLWFLARRRDRASREDPAVAAKDEWGKTDAEADPVTQWWTAMPLRLSPAERGAADRSYRVVIDVLESEGIIRPADARRLGNRKPPQVWRGEAG